MDIEDVFIAVAEGEEGQEEWPAWLLEVSAYWDAIVLRITSRTDRDERGWLRHIFGRLVLVDNDRVDIVLEGASGNRLRVIPVVFEEVGIDEIGRKRRPTFRVSTVASPYQRPVSLPALDQMPVPIVAFHSFKGGVGRTLHSIALALGIGRKGRVLLIDADLEAPGMSWLVESRLRDIPISFTDVLALVQGMEKEEEEEADTLDVVSTRMQNALIDGVFLLPAFREPSQLAHPRISPADIAQTRGDPYFLASFLARLGEQLKVSAVIVDLRAGVSETSAGLLLDPRVHRVHVTTLNSQAVEGSKLMLRLLGQRAPVKSETQPVPALILTQVLSGQDALVDKVLGELVDELGELSAMVAADAITAATNAMPTVISPFRQELLAAPSNWDELRESSAVQDLIGLLEPLRRWLPTSKWDAVPTKVRGDSTIASIDHRRNRLADVAGRLTFAETADAEDFLNTSALQRLVADHRTELPVAVVVGAKGAGKTYTYLQLVRRGSWSTFASSAEVTDEVLDARIVPVLVPQNLADSQKTYVDDARVIARQMVGSVASVAGLSERVRDILRDALGEALHEGQWRDVWLQVMAITLGIDEERAAARESLGALVDLGIRVIFVFDGLEDLFQNINSNEGQQTAVRALLQDVPEWFSQLRKHNLGILVFVRQDIVLAAVKQNPAQLLNRYGPYQLRWNTSEVLRLVAWVCAQASVLSEFPIEALRDQEEVLTEGLVRLWGVKLGRDKSREARSEEWFIAALSDFRGQVQARDVVLFLSEAADLSRNTRSWDDRLLVPTAMRDALPVCSANKIGAIEAENEALREVFDRMRSLPEDLKRNPFRRDQADVTSEDIELLSQNGVVLAEGDLYWMPEIYRLGLGFSGSSRPRIMKLARRARRI